MRGEVGFTALGESWTMFLGTAAQCALEEEHDKGFFALVQDAIPSVSGPADLEDPAKMAEAARSFRIGTLRQFAFHGLRKHHPDVSLDDVNEIIDDLGMADFGGVIGSAIAAAADKAGATEQKAAKPGNRSTRASKRTGKA